MLFSRAVIFASGMLCAISILVWLPTVALTWLPSSDPGYSKRITWSDVPYHSLDLCVCAEGLVFGWHNKDIPDVPAGFRGDAYRTRAVQFAPGNFFLGAGFYHGADLCVLVVPIWMIIFLTILAPLSSLRRRLRNQRLHSTTLCSCCHYDLRAHRPGDRCPECGILSNAPIPKLSSRLFQSRSPRFHVTFPTPLRYHSTMPPLLFIHGFPFDASMWQAQSDYFHAYAHQLLTPTLPGFGPTDLQSKMGGGENQKSKIPSTIAAYAHHLHTLIQRLPQPPIIAGFSMGGYILLALLREFPQDAAAAIFIDTRAEADSPDARASRLKSIDTIRSTGTTSTLIESLIPRLLKPNPAPDLPQKLRTLMSPQSPDAVIAAQTAMANRPDQTDLLPHVKIPALIIVGIHDIITPPSAAQTLHQIPNSQLLQIQNAGHMTPLEAPDSVNTAIEKFAAGI